MILVLSIEEIFTLALEYGYQIIRCQDYPKYKQSANNKILVNRVDIDLQCSGAVRIAEIFNKLGIKGTFFVRLHAKEYNPFSLENYRYLNFIKNSSHEIGLHSEVMDASKQWNLSSKNVLITDIEILNKMFGIKIDGISSHNGLTDSNNLDFWKDNKASDFGLLYEAYDSQPGFNLVNESIYITDSEYTQWKCYKNGILDKIDKRCLCNHLKDGNKIVYTLIHPITYKE